ncbi:CHAP domain-containing protein [Pseudoroseomonas wenyumeiae]|uniref:CHAP domain-containing protein n=1 Tax=Teichococcus wenyumeiae TaxID=2478470 RepID=A0A3A9K2V0_9PROT|nr:CHAP domain-containing protein [Pseudoroseomonas wenyumeiae]RMI26010.1 CHAP domain-containing protein [Pseudoroseomonas wenyumeiae]
MRVTSTALAVAVLMGAVCVAPTMAEATTARGTRDSVKQQRVTVVASPSRSAKPQVTKQVVRNAAPRIADFGGSISCVPYVRSVTGMEITGNAHLWWANAAGAYARGQRPERGAVMSFRSSGGMRLGHVAVVSKVVSAREVLIDHANWEGPGIRKGTVMRGVSVVDVSDRNDWSAVRVQVGRDDDAYGRVYPINGFIYNRPDNGRMMTASNGGGFEEVAEAPASPHQAHLANVVGDLNLGSARR